MSATDNVLLPSTRGLRELHLFAGAGGGVLGGMLLGHTCVCAVEIWPYCRKILLQRQRDGILPKFPIWDDVRTFDGKPWKGKVDVIAGGFPCQDISIAGKGRGIDGERSGLWREFSRIIGEIRPRYAFIENSTMLAIRGLNRVVSDLASMGYDARWGVFSACSIGAPHTRERLFVLAYPVQSGFSIRSNSEKNGQNEIGEQTRLRLAKSLEKHWLECRSPASFSGIPYGLAHRMDRVKAAGNGQVPAVVALAWRTLAGECG